MNDDFIILIIYIETLIIITNNDPIINEIRVVKTMSRKIEIYSKLLCRYVCARPYLPSHIYRNTNNHGRDSYACNECNANRGTHECSQLPKNLLLSAPRLLSPESTA